MDELLSVNELARDDVIDFVTGSYQSQHAVQQCTIILE